MTMRQMGLDDLRLVLDWAAAEGWNPGLDDAEAFLAADPGGFLSKEVDGRPVAAISVVNHDLDTAFLGLYLCHPDHRGQGHGLAVWNAGVAHAGRRSIGLDGVPAQQANYAKSGFARVGRTIRYAGKPKTGGRPADCPADHDQLVRLDQATVGHARTAFARNWFHDTANRKTLVIDVGHTTPAFATYRKCLKGVKIGPFHAHTARQARHLLDAIPWSGEVFIDIPDESTALTALVTAEGFAPVFETARMYKGTRPKGNPPPYHAVATLELG